MYQWLHPKSGSWPRTLKEALRRTGQPVNFPNSKVIAKIAYCVQGLPSVHARVDPSIWVITGMGPVLWSHGDDKEHVGKNVFFPFVDVKKLRGHLGNYCGSKRTKPFTLLDQTVYLITHSGLPRIRQDASMS